MVRFLHTADWQIGMVFRQIQEKADALRQARIDAVRAILALARSRKVDFILVAGDTFEDNRIDHRYVRDVAEVLRSSSVPVFILPGNHDPLTDDSPYRVHAELFGPPVTVLKREAPLPILEAQATLYPCPAFRREWEGDPTHWIPARQPADGIRIGVAHGPIEGTPDQCGYHIPKNAADLRGLDYVALGHWHRPMQYTRMHYSGTPEPTSFNEEGGHVLIVELDAPQTTPRVETVRVAGYHWIEIPAQVHSDADLDDVEADLARIEAPQRSVVRVRLRGMLPPTALGRIRELQERHEARFFWFNVNSDVRAETSAGAYRHPLLKAVYQRLIEKANEAASAARDPEDDENLDAAHEDAAAARRAISRLASMVAESGHGDLN